MEICVTFDDILLDPETDWGRESGSSNRAKEKVKIGIAFISQGRLENILSIQNKSWSMS